MFKQNDLDMCNKCNGTGFLKHYEHVNNGTCYSCNGTGGVGDIDISQITNLGRELKKIESNGLKVALKNKGCDITGWSSYAIEICEEYIDTIKNGVSISLNENTTSKFINKYPNIQSDIKTIFSNWSVGFKCSFELDNNKIKMTWK